MILEGNAVSAGYAIGEAYIYKPSYKKTELSFIDGDVTVYKKLLYDALKTAESEIEMLISQSNEPTDATGAIFRAQQEILLDEEIHESIEFAITEDRKMPEMAVDEVFGKFIDLLSKAKDPLIASRTSDLKDVRNRLLRILSGETVQNLASLQHNAIIVADDLLPSDTATLNRKYVLGIITQIGSETSHTAILANSYGIPAIVGVAGALGLIRNGKVLGLDAVSGKVFIEPDNAQQDELKKKKEIADEEIRATNLYLDKPCRTTDGHCIEFGVNIGSAEERDFIKHTDFVGLFRTEFLYMKSNHSPTEEEQFEAYKSILEAAAPKAVTLRTLDIGGDKTLPYLNLSQEQNPFLGMRALRLCFDNLDIFKAQLRASLRASVFGNLWIMLPMVGSLDDYLRARSIIDNLKVEMDISGIPYDQNIKIGIMVEIPSIAMISDIIAEYVDFASIGTNDLCQYFCAVDRMNTSVSAYYQSYSPAMIRILDTVVQAFKSVDKPLSVCGEMAGSEIGAALLVGMGINKLSMSYSKIGKVKKTLSGCAKDQLCNIVSQAKLLCTQSDVIELVNNEIFTALSK